MGHQKLTRRSFFKTALATAGLYSLPMNNVAGQPPADGKRVVIYPKSQSDPEAFVGADEVQRAFGYRYRLNDARYFAHVKPGATFSMPFKVTHVGSAPMYYNWPVEISLQNPATKTVVWKDTFAGCDIRSWLPGDSYNHSTRTYDNPVSDDSLRHLRTKGPYGKT